MAVTPEPPASKPKTVKAGDKVHIVVHDSTPGARFKKVHVPATVTDIPTGKELAGRKAKGTLPPGVQHVDLEAELPDGTPIALTSAPRDDSGTKSDTWHFVEDAPASA